MSEPEKHYEELIRFFFMFHDPTTKNRQGNDVGSQYSSFIFTHSDSQRVVAERVVGELQGHISRGTLSSFEGTEVKTKIGEATVFYPATQDHQNYLAKNPGGYCNHYMRFKAWPLA